MEVLNIPPDTTDGYGNEDPHKRASHSRETSWNYSQSDTTSHSRYSSYDNHGYSYSQPSTDMRYYPAQQTATPTLYVDTMPPYIPSNDTLSPLSQPTYPIPVNIYPVNMYPQAPVGMSPPSSPPPLHPPTSIELYPPLPALAGMSLPSSPPPLHPPTSIELYPSPQGLVEMSPPSSPPPLHPSTSIGLYPPSSPLPLSNLNASGHQRLDTSLYPPTSVVSHPPPSLLPHVDNTMYHQRTDTQLYTSTVPNRPDSSLATHAWVVSNGDIRHSTPIPDNKPLPHIPSSNNSEHSRYSSHELNNDNYDNRHSGYELDSSTYNPAYNSEVTNNNNHDIIESRTSTSHEPIRHSLADPPVNSAHNNLKDSVSENIDPIIEEGNNIDDEHDRVKKSSTSTSNKAIAPYIPEDVTDGKGFKTLNKFRTNRGENIIYADKFIVITDMFLYIKRYYFPSCDEVFIPLDEIDRIWKVRDEIMLKWSECCRWGVGLSNIWWAAHMGRNYKTDHLLVVKAEGDWWKKGFTIADKEAEVILRREVKRARKERNRIESEARPNYYTRAVGSNVANADTENNMASVTTTTTATVNNGYNGDGHQRRKVGGPRGPNGPRALPS